MATDPTAPDDMLPWETKSATPGVVLPRTEPRPASGSSTAVPLPPAIAAGMPKVAGFALHEEIGRGGMGIVYRATQKGLNRTVALKMVVGAADGSSTAERFIAEAEAVASVRHPQVVQVFEYGNLGGIPFLAMEYLPGGSLSDAITKHGRMLPSDAVKLIGELAAAVGAAHDQGIVHRDLKPGNVLYSDAGVAKVTDFGLAKRTNHDLTRTGMVFGTPSYMAPEQAKGEAKRVGPPADVWALGVMLYELLTGAVPFRGDRMETILWSVVYEEPPSPRTLVPRIPLDLELICLKCLLKDPSKRYPTATALASELECYAVGEPISVRKAGRVERFAGWARKRPSLAANIGLAAVVGLLLVFGGLLFAQYRTIDELTKVAEARQSEVVELQERAKAETALRTYADLVRRAGRELRFGDEAAAGRSLAACPEAVRGWEWHLLSNRKPTAVDAEKLLAGLVPDVGLPAGGLHLDGSSLPQVVRRTGNGTMYTAGLPTGEVQVWDRSGRRIGVFGIGMVLPAGVCGPKGRQLAFCRLTGQVQFISIGAKAVPVPDPHPAGAGVTAAAFSPDGRRAATAAGGEVVVRDAETGQAIQRLAVPPGFTPSALAFRPTNDRLAVRVAVGWILVFELRTGEPVWDEFAASAARVKPAPVPLIGGQPVRDESPEWLAFDPTGQFLLTGRTGQPTVVYDGSVKSPGSAVAPVGGVP